MALLFQQKKLLSGLIDELKWTGFVIYNYYYPLEVSRV